jgi:hypothetical protein
MQQKQLCLCAMTWYPGDVSHVENNLFCCMNRGLFHKSCEYGLKHRAHPNLGENAVSWPQGANALWQIRVNLWENDGCRAQISSVGHKLHYEIQPRSPVAESEFLCYQSVHKQTVEIDIGTT